MWCEIRVECFLAGVAVALSASLRRAAVDGIVSDMLGGVNNN